MHKTFMSKSLIYSRLAFLLITAALLSESCHNNEPARLTRVYGKVTDQAGQPVDSVTILFAGTVGVTGGFPIKETLTDSNGSYELVVDVPRRYHSPSINLSFERQELLDKYLKYLVYENGVQKGSCCFVVMGGKTKYDFVLLPK
ncbi:MAG TPA: carboxypeptidase-like regulatory domain-containing protein [Coleofasciculaceae cyanobacterium]|jgi:hypothetical protein